ncbi:CHASE domain-containing protein [Mariniblastus sp.]|nr:CHASE domain-containing protein [Mariniblastus sp.]
MPNALTQNIDQSNTLRDARGKLVAASKLHWLHWLIVLGSLILTFLAWYYASSEKEARIQVQFDRESDRVIELVKERMGKYEDALWGGVAFIRTSEKDVDFETWQRYAKSINIEDKYPGINGIGVIHSVADGDFDNYLAKQREQRPDYQVHPPHDRSKRYPISYVIPVQGNEKAVGLDMAHEVNRYTATQRARDFADTTITGPITLVQDTGKTPGFLLFAPFYKDVDKDGGDGSNGKGVNGNSGSHGSISSDLAKERRSNFAGMVYAPFVVKKLMEGTLGKDMRQVAIRIRDGQETLYDEHQGHEPDFDPKPLFTRSLNVELFGRQWKIDIWSAKSFRQATSDSQPLTILIGGILVDALLISLFLSISRTSRKSLGLADSMTAQLTETTQKLEQKAVEMQSANDRLRRYNTSVVERELWMVGLKQEVNDFLEQKGEPPRYSLTALAEELFSEETQSHAPEVIYQEIELVSKIAELESTQIATLNMMEDTERARQKLETMNDALQQSNQDLEQFAFIASHDLQEPLRKVASFCSLLQSDYGDRLDDDGRQYLDFAVDGATRMKSLVQDLLTYSKIGSQDKQLEKIDPHEALEMAGINLELLINESNATITCDQLPEIYAHQREIAQLFQNLIGNAIKYRSEEDPEVHVTSIDSGNCWQFFVSDNGIGIAPEYQEQVFGIFKRLHSRKEYSGTGIGLAICKRIVEQLGGKIWFQQKAEPGCTVCFTVPKQNAGDAGHPTLKMPPFESRPHEHVSTK